MTFKVLISDVEIDPEWVLLPVDQGLTENADGTTARAGVVIDDPTGTFDLTGWKPFNVEDDDCTPARIFTGFVVSRGISRGPYREGAGRIWNCDLLDLNQLLHIHILKNADAKRPQETGTERLAWLLTTTVPFSEIHDNGNVMANAWTYDATDYRGQYADDVLRDIVSANTDDRWTFFVYRDETATPGEELSLFYGSTTAALYDSTLRISNVIADQDATTLYPLVDAELERDPSGQYGGVYVTGAFGRLYDTNLTTIAAMGVQRDGTYTSARLINTATAQAHATRYLDWHALEQDVITCTVRVPSTQVNLILPGSRIQVKFTHLPGYESFPYTRVQSRTVVLGEDWMYDLHLTLSLKGILQSGGGDPGDFPAPGETEPDVTITACNDVLVSGIRNAEVGGGTGLVGASETWYYRITNTVHDALSVTNDLVIKRSDALILETIATGVPPQVILDPGPATFYPYPTTEGSFTTPSTGVYPAGFVFRVSSDYGTGNPIFNECWKLELWKDNPPETPPPAPGQWVYGELVTMTGASGTTAAAYAPGSLHVYVDGIPISSASFTEDDPGAGTFTLAWTPDADEVVRVDYQGI